MISFEELRLDDESPIYLQIIRFIKRGIAAGTVKSGEEMPSRRVLSALLGVNPNTIQKAYRQLEEEGIIVSHAGAKSFVAADEAVIAKVRTELIRSDVQYAVHALQQMGVAKEDALKMLSQMWDEEGER